MTNCMITVFLNDVRKTIKICGGLIKMPGTEQGFRIVYVWSGKVDNRQGPSQDQYRYCLRNIGGWGRRQLYGMQTTIIVYENNDGGVMKYSIAVKDDDYADYVHDCTIMRNMKKDKTRRRQICVKCGSGSEEVALA